MIGAKNALFLFSKVKEFESSNNAEMTAVYYDQIHNVKAELKIRNKQILLTAVHIDIFFKRRRLSEGASPSKEAKYMDALNMIKKAKRSGAIDSFAQVNLFKALEVFKSTSRRSTQVSRFKNKSKKESYLLRIDKDSVSVIVEPLEEKNAKTKNCSNLLSWL